MGAALAEHGIVASTSSVSNWEANTVPQRKKVDLDDLLRAWADITDVSYVWLASGQLRMKLTDSMSGANESDAGLAA